MLKVGGWALAGYEAVMAVVTLHEQGAAKAEVLTTGGVYEFGPLPSHEMGGELERMRVVCICEDADLAQAVQVGAQWGLVIHTGARARGLVAALADWSPA